MKTIDNKKENEIIDNFFKNKKTEGNNIALVPFIDKPGEKYEQGEYCLVSPDRDDTETKNLPIETKEKNVEVVKIKPYTNKDIRKSVVDAKEWDSNNELISNNNNSSHTNEAEEVLGGEFLSQDGVLYEKEDSKLFKQQFQEGIKHKDKFIFFTEIFALFFFLGLCMYSSGKLNIANMGNNIFVSMFNDTMRFSSFCVNCSPIVFLSFLVFASGFTIYAPTLAFMFSVGISFFAGVVSGCIVYFSEMFFLTFLSLLLVGVFSVMCIVLCVFSNGVSKVASEGVNKISISDGLIFTASYIGYIVAAWGIANGISALIIR